MPINEKIMDMKGLSLKCTSILNDSGTEMVGTSAGLNGVLGATTPAAATVTTLTASGALTATGGVDGVLGGVTPAAATVTTLTATTVANTAINVPKIVRQSADLSATSGGTGVTLTDLTGLVHTVVPGTYAFTIQLGTVATANSGLKIGLKLTTTVLTSIEYQAAAGAAAAVVNSRGTTATDQMSLIASTTAVLNARITGTMVVGTGGTIKVQFAQNASHADTTTVYTGSTFELIRIA